MADSINISYGIADLVPIEIKYTNESGGTDVIVLESGPAGLSAYDIAVEQGFVGTKQEWLDSLSVVVGSLEVHRYIATGAEPVVNGASIWNTGIADKDIEAIIMDTERPFLIADETNTLETDILDEGVFVYIKATGEMRYAPQLPAGNRVLTLYKD